MSAADPPAPGAIIWTDLTVPDAAPIRDFYSAVVGWRAEPVEMDGYADFNMLPPSGDRPTAGICYARGLNADLPPVWLVYIVVEDLAASLTRCVELGGRILVGPDQLGPETRHSVIQDPAGAVVALYCPPDEV